mmetsp:Transcript_6704/g.17534  ORF Transcript_6704/g.17534 Transcript_6704/m.17534 type:complete len:91 (-) Transcript_6704:405-677(-)
MEADSITVVVLLFASARELANTDRCVMNLAAGSKASALREALATKFPLLRITALADDTAIAINQQYVSFDDDPVLNDHDEVALIPPISGG